MNVWLTARGAGLSALVLLTISTSLGALVSMRGKAATRYVLQYVHRICGGLGLGVLALHLTTILVDTYAHVGVTGALVPFTSGYRASAVGLGTLAAYAFVGVGVFGYARGRIAASATGARAWRVVHSLAYLGWGAAVLHGLTAGTDSSVGWVRALYVGCVAAVVGALAARLTHRRLIRTAQGALQ